MNALGDILVYGAMAQGAWTAWFMVRMRHLGWRWHTRFLVTVGNLVVYALLGVLVMECAEFRL